MVLHEPLPWVHFEYNTSPMCAYETASKRYVPYQKLEGYCIIGKMFCVKRPAALDTNRTCKGPLCSFPVSAGLSWILVRVLWTKHIWFGQNSLKMRAKKNMLFIMAI